MKQVFYFWLRPGQIIDVIELEDTSKTNAKINLILILASIYLSLQYHENRIEGINMPEFTKEYPFMVLFAFLMLFFFRYVLTFLFWAFGKIFQGESTIHQTRIVVAYSLTPTLVLLPFAVIQFILILSLHPASMGETFSAMFKFVFSVLTFSYLVIGLCKVNKFSYGYGILTVLLVGFLMELVSLLR